MKPFNLVLFVLLLISLYFSALTAGSIKGKVFDRNTHQPLEGTNIQISNSNLGSTTESDGGFIINKIPDGAHTIVVSYMGYKTLQEIVDIEGSKIYFRNIYLEPVTLEGESIIVNARSDPGSAIQRESPIAFERLTTERLKYNYSTGDLPELIKMVPGVWTSSAGLGESEIFMRGFSESGIRFMLNGIMMNNPEDNNIIWSDWAGLSHMAQSIEIQRGPGYSPLASNGFAGNININTVGISPRRVTSFRVSAGLFKRMGIESGSNAGNIVHPESGITSEGGNWPTNYTYSARFASGPLYDGKLNMTLFLERKYGDSYILGTNYNGYTIGLEGESNLDSHNLYFVLFASPQSHAQAFALQDIDLLPVLGREYNRKNHEWQENNYTKPYASLKHTWHISDTQLLTNNIFFTFGIGADQTCTNDLFDTKTGSIRFQPSTKGDDALAFGSHAMYLYHNYGLLTSDFEPPPDIDHPYFVFKGIPFEGRDGPKNFFADLHTHSYQNRRQRDHWQIGLSSTMSQRLNYDLNLDFGVDGRYWRGHRESKVLMLKVSDFSSYRPPWTPMTEDTFIDQVQSIYDYYTDVWNLSAFIKTKWQPSDKFNLQGGLQLNYSRLEVIENPIQLIDFGSWEFFDEAKRTTVDIYDKSRKFAVTNDYLRHYTYLSPWIGGNYNLDDKINFFARIASAKREPSIHDWYDFSSGPLFQQEYYPEREESVTMKPESVISIEIGTGYKGSIFEVNANYYHSQYYDKIESVLDINQRQTTMNAGRALLQGIELLFKMKAFKFDFTGSATLARNRWQQMNVDEIFDSKAEDVIDKVVPFAPEQMLTAALGYNFNIGSKNQFRLEGRVNFWDEYYGTYTNTYLKTYENIVDGAHYQEISYHSSKLPYFLDLSAHLHYALKLSPFDLTFRIDANNILNRSDNFMRARYSIDYTRNDFQAGRYNWYVLQAPLFNIFFTTEISIAD